MSRLAGPAYRIETARTRVRCFAPSDGPRLSRAVEDSLPHLAPWLPWTLHEPLSPAQRLEWLRTQRGHFDLGGDYAFIILSKDESVVLGGAGMHLRGDVDEREIGYWIHVDHVRQGLCTEVTAALVKVGFEIEDLRGIDIKVLPHNVASASVPEKLGFDGPVLEPYALPWPGEGKRDAHRYSLSRVKYASSSARAAEIQAYDVLDRRLL